MEATVKGGGGWRACDAPPRVCTCTAPWNRRRTLSPVGLAFLWLFRCLQAGGGVQVGHQGGGGPVPRVVLRRAVSAASGWHFLVDSLLWHRAVQGGLLCDMQCAISSTQPAAVAGVRPLGPASPASQLCTSSNRHILPLSWANSSINSLSAALVCSGATSPRRTASARSGRPWRARVRLGGERRWSRLSIPVRAPAWPALPESCCPAFGRHPAVGLPSAAHLATGHAGNGEHGPEGANQWERIISMVSSCWTAFGPEVPWGCRWPVSCACFEMLDSLVPVWQCAFRHAVRIVAFTLLMFSHVQPY